MTQKYTIRRLKNGEATNPETDFCIDSNGDVIEVFNWTYNSNGQHPHYRITPAPETGKVEIDPGEGWRWVEKREGIEKGDQRKVNGLWMETEFWGPNIHASDEKIFRRRIAPAPVESVPGVDVVRHEVNELRKANAELLERCLSLQKTRDQLAERFGKQTDNYFAVSEKCSEEIVRANNITAERDKLKSELEELKRQANRGADLGNLIPIRFYSYEGCDDFGAVQNMIIELAWLKSELETEQAEFVQACIERDAWKEKCEKLTDQLAAKADQKEDWRELSKGDTYSGPGQVRDKPHHDWIDATIAACDNREGLPFIARAKHHSAYDAWAFARIKESEQSQ